ncbi:MAG: NAD-dependent epimerase/dehydratase family protein [Lysobacteraceae bacterium]|nr:MAG: NAD-dependent epimerase/dehydratase family protein [Xanthomonadaceae bacterium]
MEVFMTGANGFVGLNTVAALKQAGHSVVAMIRPNANVAFLEPMGVRIVHGQLDDVDALTAAMRGADAVVHTAGNTSCNPRDLPALEAVNVHGTRNVVEAAFASGVKRLVYTSTTSTIGTLGEAGDPVRRADESTPLTGYRAKSPYAITKRRAEEIVLDAHRRGLHSVILNPAEVIGAYDYNMQWGRMVLAAFYDQVPFVPPGGGSFCCAAAVGRAHASALERGESGERYILAGHDATYRAFIDTMAQVLDKPVSLPKNSYRALYWKSLLQEKLSPLVPGKPPVETYRMKVFSHPYYFDSGKAERALGYASAPLADMLRDSARWYRDHGFIRA